VFQFDPADKDSIPRTDPTNLDELLGELALVDVETGAAQRISGSVRLAGYRLSPDRRQLAWAVATRFARPGSHQILADLVVYDFATRRTKHVAADVAFADGYPLVPLISWSPAGRGFAYRTDGAGAKDEIYVVALDGQVPQRVASGPVLEHELRDDHPPLWDKTGQYLFFVRAGHVWRAPADGRGATQFASAPGRDLRLIEAGSGRLWSPDDGSTAIVFTANRKTKQAGIARMDLTTGTVTQLLQEDKLYNVSRATAPAVMPDGKGVLFAAEDAGHPPDLWITRVDPWSEPEQVSRVGAELAGVSLGRTTVIEWRTLDGDTLHGALIYPAGYRPGVPYPMIVKVYGGTSLSDDANRFGCADSPVDNLQLFASRGYAVLLVDSKLAVGTPMLDLLKSVMPGVDRAVELGIADPGRVGIMGHSYGGYGTLSLIAQSHRFRAAVMRAGIGDLVSAYGRLSEVGTNYWIPWAERGQGRMGGTPWDVRERYIENSPIFFLDRVQTPLLIIHGGADSPVFADEVFSGLRRLGKRVEYARYTGETHDESVWSKSNQIDYVRRVIAWFDRYLKAAPRPPRSLGSPEATPDTTKDGRMPVLGTSQ
jgi:dipeptidyl aminopeptidase/acylaminoacyl peptidase